MRAALSMGDWPTLAFGCGTSSTLVRIGSKRDVASRRIPPYRATPLVSAVAKITAWGVTDCVREFFTAPLGWGWGGVLNRTPPERWWWRAAASRHTARPRALRRLHDSSVGAKARVSPFLLPPSWGWDAAVPYTVARAGLGVALGSTTMRNA